MYPPSPPKRVWIRVRVEEEILARMVESHIQPSTVFMRNVRAELQKREKRRAELRTKEQRRLNPYLPLAYQEP